MIKLNIIEIILLYLFYNYNMSIIQNSFVFIFNIGKNELNNKINNLIYKNKINNINNDTIYKKKNVIYGALFGNYDRLKPFKKQEEFDYFLFTDNIIKIKTNWTILKIPDIVNNLHLNIIKKQRFIKLHPHLFFKNYDLSIYIDTTFIIIGDIIEFLERLLTPKFNIYIFEHPRRNCIYSEISAVIKCKKEKKNIAINLKNKYKNMNYPKNIGLSENCLIIRRHNEKKCINLMEKWWEEIKNFSKRDQLSLNYVIWRTGIKIKYISKQFGLYYFYQKKHLKKKVLKNSSN